MFTCSRHHLRSRYVAVVAFGAATVLTLLAVGPAPETAHAAGPAAAPNKCGATSLSLASGLNYRVITTAGKPVYDTAGAVVGTTNTDSDMQVVSPDGRYLYTVTETPQNGQLLRVDISTGQSVLMATNASISLDNDGKPVESDSAGKPLNGFRRLDPIKWMPDGKSLIFGEEAKLGRNFSLDLATGEWKPLDATGWFEHEAYAFTSDGKFYQGDELANGGIYRFTPSRPDYSDGTLEYLLKSGTWKVVATPRTAQAEQQADPDSAKFQRIEDFEIGPDGYIYGTETDYPNDSNSFNNGRVFRFRPGDSGVIPETWVGGATGFALGELNWPDNIIFDSKGNLIIAEDIPDDFGAVPATRSSKQFNNQQDDLWLVTPGKQTFRLAAMADLGTVRPCEHEWTGMAFSPDGNTLYVNAQHASNEVLAIGNYLASVPTGSARGAAPGPPNTGNANGSGRDYQGDRDALMMLFGGLLAAVSAATHPPRSRKGDRYGPPFR